VWGLHEFRHARQQRAVCSETERRRLKAAATEQANDDTEGRTGASV
jgi:hypothetical protein